MNSWNLLNLSENDVLLYFDYGIGKLIFLYVNVHLGATSVCFYFFKPLYLWFCLLEFQNNGQAFIQSRNIWHRDTERSHSDLCMCTPPLMCMWWVGWLYVLPCHLVAPTGFANATVWVTLRQFAPHCLIFLFFPPLGTFISSLAASPHMGSVHPAVVFIITAVFLFCSSGCTWPP